MPTLPVIARANATLTDAPLPADDRSLFAGTPARWATDAAWVAGLGIDHLCLAVAGPIGGRLRAMGELRERAA